LRGLIFKDFPAKKFLIVDMKKNDFSLNCSILIIFLTKEKSFLPNLPKGFHFSRVNLQSSSALQIRCFPKGIAIDLRLSIYFSAKKCDQQTQFLIF